MFGAIYCNVACQAPELLAAFATVSTAALSDAMGRHGAMKFFLKPIYDDIRMVGAALTVLCFPGDIVVGDPDGVVVVPLASAEQVLENALARERLELRPPGVHRGRTAAGSGRPNRNDRRSAEGQGRGISGLPPLVQQYDNEHF